MGVRVAVSVAVRACVRACVTQPCAAARRGPGLVSHLAVAGHGGCGLERRDAFGFFALWVERRFGRGNGV